MLKKAAAAALLALGLLAPAAQATKTRPAEFPAQLWLVDAPASNYEYRLPTGCSEYPVPCSSNAILACTSGADLPPLVPARALSVPRDAQEVYLVGVSRAQTTLGTLADWGLPLLAEIPLESADQLNHNSGLAQTRRGDARECPRTRDLAHIESFAVVGVQNQLADLEPFLRRGDLHQATKLQVFPHAPTHFTSGVSGIPAETSESEEQVIRDILSRIGNPEFMLRLEELSGAREFRLDGQGVTTRTRYTHAAPHNLNARFAEQLFTREWGCDEAYLQPFTVGGSPTQNVIGVKRGQTTPDRIFVIGAHYDSTSQQASTLAPGAVDNGSGSAAVMLIAKALAPYRFASTIHFVLFGGEEQGLHGSAFYVREAQAKGWNIVNALTMDMIAYSSRYYGVTIEGTRNTAISQLMDAYAAAVRQYAPKLTLNLSYNSFGSDHVSFQRAGIPAILAIEQDDTNYPGYHKTTDTVAYANADQSTDIARPLAALLARQAGIIVRV